MRMLLLLLLSLWLTSDNTEAGFRAEFNYLISETPSEGGDYRLKGLFVDGDALGFSVDSVNVGYYFYDSRGIEFEIVYSNKMQPLIIEVDRVGHGSAPTTGIGLLTDRTTNISLPYETSKISQKLQSFIESEVRYDIDDSNLLRLADLVDVDTTGETAGSILLYNTTSQNWEAKANSIDNLTDGYKTGLDNLILGREPFPSYSGTKNIIITTNGIDSLRSPDGYSVGMVIIGDNAYDKAKAGAANSVVIGSSAMVNSTGIEDMVVIGGDAAKNASTHSGVYIGSKAGRNLSGSVELTRYNTIIGSGAQEGGTNVSEAVVIGTIASAPSNTINSIVIGSGTIIPGQYIANFGKGSNSAKLGNERIDSTFLYGNLVLPEYGLGNKEAADLTKTRSRYIAAFATDGTLLELDTTGLFGGGASDLGSLTDVDTTGKASGYVLAYNPSTSTWEAQDNTLSIDSIGRLFTISLGTQGVSFEDQVGLTSVRMADLVDVDTTGVDTNYIAKYSPSAGGWKMYDNNLDGLTDVVFDIEQGNLIIGDTTNIPFLPGPENNSNLAIGRQFLFRNLAYGNENIIIGTAAMLQADTAVRNTHIGKSTAGGGLNTSIDNFLNSKSIYSTSLGVFASALDTLLINTVSIGEESNVFFSPRTLKKSINSVFVGALTKPFSAISIDEIVIGAEARGKGDSTVTLGRPFYKGTYLNGNLNLNGYGLGNKEAADLTKTRSRYIAAFATDGTLLELDTTGLFAGGSGTPQTLSFSESTRELTISDGNTIDLSEGIQEEINSTLVAGTNIAKVYNDGANTLTLSTTDALTAIDAITFDANTTTAVANRLQFNTNYNTLTFGMANATPIRIGQDLGWLVKNQTGATIGKGVAVMAVGVVGSSGRVLVDELVADGSVDAHYFLGITAESIANGDNGFVTSQGHIRGVNTSSFAEGTVLYADPANPGGFTATEPTGSNLKLPLAFVLNSGINNGEIAVRADPGASIKDLHDVDVAGIANNSILKYDGTKWVAGTDEIGSDTNLGNADLGMSGTGGVRTATFDNNTLNIEAQNGYINLGNIDNNFDGSYLRMNNITDNTNIFGKLISFGGDQTEVLGSTRGGKLQFISYGRGLQQSDDDVYLLTVDAAGFVQEIPLGNYLTSEVDGSVTNEGALSVTAGSATTSVINSNTSGSTPVTLSASTGLTISEAGNTITLTNSAPEATSAGDGLTLDGSQVRLGGTIGTSRTVTLNADNFQFTSSNLDAGYYIDNVSNNFRIYGQALLMNYGSGSYTGTVSKILGVTSNGQVVETTVSGGGISLTDLSVTTAAAGNAALSYNNTNGVFTFTPPDLSSYLTSEVDGSVTNEGALSVTAGSATTSVINSNTSGSTPVTLSASTGLSIDETGNTITLTNAAPDQTVSLTGAGITAISGTYPNFTITSTEVDGSTSNEGALSASTLIAGTIARLTSNTNGGSNVDFSAGTGIAIGSSGGNTISITNSLPESTTASGGLTKVGNDIRLGGSFTNNVSIQSVTGALDLGSQVGVTITGRGGFLDLGRTTSDVATLSSPSNALNISAGFDINFMNGVSNKMHLKTSTGVLTLNDYGQGTKEAADLSKTASAYLAGFATDGTLIDFPISTFVTSATNGLTKQGNNLILGGTLSAATGISMNGNNFGIYNDEVGGVAITLDAASNTLFTNGLINTDYGEGNREAEDGYNNFAYYAAFSNSGELIEVKNKIVNGTSGTIDWQNAPQRIHVLDFGANTSITLSFTNVAVGGIYTLRVTGNSGTDTLVWPGSAKFEDGTSAGTVTLQDGGQMFTFYWDGTNYWVK